MTFHRRTTDAAAGKWRGILLRLGLPEAALRGKHCACPMCGGADRFRFDNKEGRGTWICNACGAGDGMALAMAFTGRPFADVAAEVDAILGNEQIGTERPPAEMTEAQRKAALREVVAQTVRAEPGDLVDVYLTSRGLGELVYPKVIRFARSLRDGEGGVRPAMVAVVQDAEGNNVSLHRTFLRPDGGGKAEMAAPRKLMPGPLPEGSCVRLSDYTGGCLGIAEGIETAMAASALYEIPVWAALNASMLARWQPPEGCGEVAVFADNDAKFGGQAAAYGLAHRLGCKGLTVTTHLPEVLGDDFADVWFRRWSKGA
jgi:putative DNA primase/helicase